METETLGVILCWLGLTCCIIGAIGSLLIKHYALTLLMIGFVILDIITLNHHYNSVKNIETERTIEIIKPGNVNKIEGHCKYECTCPACDCEFIFEDMDILYVQKECDSWVHCPTCGLSISVSSANVKQKTINSER